MNGRHCIGYGCYYTYTSKKHEYCFLHVLRDSVCPYIAVLSNEKDFKIYDIC